MPKRNQKEMSEHEKTILKEAQAKRKETDKKDLDIIKMTKNELFEQEKKNLPEILKKRTEQLSEELANSGKIPLSQARIQYLISSKSYNPMAKFSNDELIIAFHNYKELILKINEMIRKNEKDVYVPSKQSFCAYLGISTNAFDSWLNSSNEERREIAKMIDDYILDGLLNASQFKQIDNITALHKSKAQHKQTEATAPLVIEHKTQASSEELKDRLSMLTRKGVKTIDAEFKEK